MVDMEISYAICTDISFLLVTTSNRPYISSVRV